MAEGAEAVEAEAVEAEAVEAEAVEAEAEDAAEEAATEETVEEATEEAVAEEPAVEEPAEQAAEAVAEPAAEAAPAAPAYPADLIIQPIDPASAKQAPVAFSHASHTATDCAVCHHKGGEVACASAGCHTDTSTKKIAPGATENVSFDAAFHLKGDKSCVGCHRTAKAGPTKCNECHPK